MTTAHAEVRCKLKFDQLELTWKGIALLNPQSNIPQLFCILYADMVLTVTLETPNWATDKIWQEWPWKHYSFSIYMLDL